SASLRSNGASTMCVASVSTPGASGSCARWRATSWRRAIAPCRCWNSCCTRRRRHERFVFRALRHHRRGCTALHHALPRAPCADPRALAGNEARGAPYRRAVERPLPGESRQNRPPRAARVRLARSDGAGVSLARARAGARGLPRFSAVRGNGDAPGDAQRRSMEETIMKPKQHLEFVKVDLNSGWERPPGYPPGFYQKILGSDLDEENK